MNVDDRRRAVLMRSGRVLLAVGLLCALFVGYEMVSTTLDHDRQQSALLASFQQAVPTTTLDSPKASLAEGSAVALLDIPSIGVHQVVVEGTTPEDLTAGPGHLRASPLPGEFGVAVIAGHRTTYGGPFGNLDHLERGDDIDVATGQGSFTYHVTDVRHLDGGLDQAPQTGERSLLELVTSDPAFLPGGRLVVDASLHGPPVAVADRAPVSVGSVDLGLDGDAGGILVALLWALATVALIVVLRRVRTRWPRTVTYMFASPVLVALVVLAFSSLDRVLPGTL